MSRVASLSNIFSRSKSTIGRIAEGVGTGIAATLIAVALVVLVCLLIAIVIAIGAAIWGVIAFFVWNTLGVGELFGLSEMSIKQALVVGIIMTLFLGGNSSRS